METFDMKKSVNELFQKLQNELHEKDHDFETVDLFNKLLREGEFSKSFKYEHDTGFKSEAHTLPESNNGSYDDIKRPFYFLSMLHEDYFTWHNFFICVFKDNKNFVLGDFEDVVVASNKRAYDYFTSIITPYIWDYWDI